jgi:predicted PurR-regulated permease PerM
VGLLIVSHFSVIIAITPVILGIFAGSYMAGPLVGEGVDAVVVVQYVLRPRLMSQNLRLLPRLTLDLVLGLR